MKVQLILFLAIVICLTVAAEDELVTKVQQGSLKGVRLFSASNKVIHAYLSIPYASPPTGTLRFKDPVPHPNWHGQRSSAEMPDYCLQYNLGKKMMNQEPLVGKEDCLYLNIFKPAVTTFQRRVPVIVFFHGGAFMYGGAKDYTPRNFLDHDVILVVVQYRLGVLGFMSTHQRPLTGNYGLKDQQLALKWVYENIGKFNGDPDRITILGESAGAASVHYHMLSDGSKGLFNRAIMMSGNALAPWAHSTHHREFAIQIGKHFDCTLDAGSFQYRECMQKISASEIAKYHASTMVFSTLPNYMVPRVDGSFLKNYPEILMAYGLYRPIDVIIGMTGDEGARVLASLDTAGVLEEAKTSLDIMLMIEKENYTEHLAENIVMKYNNNKRFYLVEDDMLVQMYGDRYFNFAHYVVSTHFRNNPFMQTYIYELDYVTTSRHDDPYSEVPSRYASQMENLRILFSGGGMFYRKLVDKSDVVIQDLLLTFFSSFAQSGSMTLTDDNNRPIWEPSNRDTFEELRIRYKSDNLTFPLRYCEMETLHISEILQSWLRRPLEQSLLLLTNNDDKIERYYGEKTGNLCYTNRPKLSEEECIDYINSMAKYHWINQTLAEDAVNKSITTGEWKVFPVATRFWPTEEPYGIQTFFRRIIDEL